MSEVLFLTILILMCCKPPRIIWTRQTVINEEDDNNDIFSIIKILANSFGNRKLSLYINCGCVSVLVHVCIYA